MQNAMQPLINLTTANIEAFSRFGKSSDISNIAKHSTGKMGEMDLSNFSQIFNSKAFSELMQTCMDNYKRFAEECMQGATATFSQGRKALEQNLDAAKKPAQAIANAVTHNVKVGADAADSFVKSGTEVMERATDNTANTLRQAAVKTDKAVAETSKAIDGASKDLAAETPAAGSNLDGHSEAGHHPRERPSQIRTTK